MAKWTHGLLLLFLAIAPQTHAQPPWHHPPSPYRFTLTVKHPPNIDSTGVLLSLPLCALANPSGRDLIVFTSDGRQLNAKTLGPAMKNTTLVQVEPVPVDTRLFAYFGSQQPAPQNRMMFTQPLMCEVRNLTGAELDSFKQVQDYWKDGKTVGRFHTPTIELAHNPVSSDDQFMVEFTGHLNIQSAGDHTFMVVIDDAGYLEINDTLVIEYNGRHSPHESARGEQRATVELPAGPAKIRLLVAEGGGGQMAVLARYHNERDKAVLQADDYLRPGHAEIETVAARSGPPPPVFSYTAKAYIGYGDTYYTLVTFQTLAEEFTRPPTWKFGDGGRDTGPMVEHLFVGIDRREVAVTHDKLTATGIVDFPEKAPARWHIRNPNHFDTFAKAMLKNDVETLDTPTLLGYRKFLEFREFNPDLAPVCRALLKRQELKLAERIETTVQLARITVTNSLKNALKLYREALNLVVGDDMPDWAAEPVEMAVLSGQTQAAKNLVQWLDQRFSPPSGSFDYLRTYTALISGNFDEFNDQLYKLIHRRDSVEEYRQTTVRGNALEQRFHDLLKAEFSIQARNILQQWEMLAPEDHRSGALALARAAWLVDIGRPDNALTLLDQTVARDPLVARLPEIDYLRYTLHRRLGNDQKAKELRRRIAQDYPNHPVAQELKK